MLEHRTGDLTTERERGEWRAISVDLLENGDWNAVDASVFQDAEVLIRVLDDLEYWRRGCVVR